MNFLPAKLGAQKKQAAILGGLVVVLIVVYLFNRTPDAPAAAQRPAAAIPPTTNPLGPRTPPAPRATTRTVVQRAVEEFRPTLKLKEGTDLARIDPTIHTDLLDRLRKAQLEAGGRSIFDFSQPPPPPPPPAVKIKVGPVVTAANTPPVDPAKITPPPPPPPPPIPLKFYGYANTLRGGPKRAFFLDGEEIFVAGENEMVRNRYKIIRIGLNSAVVEDTSNKNQQTLPLEAELAG